jgi:hypothetical protein
MALLGHGASVPLTTSFANFNAPPEVARDGLQMADQSRFLGLDRRDQPIVESTATAAPDACWQRSEGPPGPSNGSDRPSVIRSLRPLKRGWTIQSPGVQRTPAPLTSLQYVRHRPDFGSGS